MNLIEFNKILIQPNQIKKDQIGGLKTIIEEYPFFQVAHFLHLKALKTRHSFKYNDYLKKTAAYTTDRSVLFDSITSDDLDIHPAPAHLTEVQEGQKEEEQRVDTNFIEEIIEEDASPEEKEAMKAKMREMKEEETKVRKSENLHKFTDSVHSGSRDDVATLLLSLASSTRHVVSPL